MVNKMSEILLTGHSGCKIYLVTKENGDKYIKKISSNINYNKRLFHQCEKQINFQSDTIKTPKVFSYDINEDGLFQFHMEYINGITLAEYMNNISVNRIKDIVKLIIGNYENENIGQITESQIKEKFLHKLNSLANSIDLTDKIIKESFEVLKKYNYKNFILSNCHGDLTLENIIISNNNIYYIDFLDSFHDSWLIDIGKLLQDIQTFWSYRNKENLNENLLIRLMIFRDILIQELVDKNPKYFIDVYIALLINLLRIVPYTRDVNTANFIHNKIELVLKIVEGALKSENLNYTMHG